MDKIELGRLGEEHAARYLESKGYRIVGRNLRYGREEIDIIAEKDDTVVFAEVKTRRMMPDSHSPFGTPSSAVDCKKQEHLVHSAEAYIKETGCEKSPRIDVIEVYSHPNHEGFSPVEVRHFERAVRKRGKFSLKKYHER